MGKTSGGLDDVSLGAIMIRTSCNITNGESGENGSSGNGTSAGQGGDTMLLVVVLLLVIMVVALLLAVAVAAAVKITKSQFVLKPVALIVAKHCANEI
ncbi:MAG TPA: hypothetical protein VEL11_09660 [Candidatus Bathyarchaeia archaeon]|nr:hypothetical protein [Candidatus Bathyarchaeia archaeon]